MPNVPKYDRPSNLVITVPDPDNMPVSSYAEKGGTLQWRTDTHQYPNFEIRFQGSNPSNARKNLVLKGSDVQPVVLRLKTTGAFKYTIRHIKKDGTHVDIGPINANVHPCPGCPP